MSWDDMEGFDGQSGDERVGERPIGNVAVNARRKHTQRTTATFVANETLMSGAATPAATGRSGAARAHRIGGRVQIRRWSSAVIRTGRRAFATAESNDLIPESNLLRQFCVLPIHPIPRSGIAQLRGACWSKLPSSTHSTTHQSAGAFHDQRPVGIRQDQRLRIDDNSIAFGGEMRRGRCPESIGFR